MRHASARAADGRARRRRARHDRAPIDPHAFGLLVAQMALAVMMLVARRARRPELHESADDRSRLQSVERAVASGRAAATAAAAESVHAPAARARQRRCPASSPPAPCSCGRSRSGRSARASAWCSKDSRRPRRRPRGIRRSTIRSRRPDSSRRCSCRFAAAVYFTPQDTADDAPRRDRRREHGAAAVAAAQDPLDKRVFFNAFTPGQKSQWRTIVGVVSDVRYRGIDEVQLDIYDPALQVGQPARYADGSRRRAIRRRSPAS